ncbi:hypothetical protein MGMO_41c00080 [Methyloglobulus morosus KoM1]|uniref:Cytochrome c domain-containing protein n=1 Tax=Methyloglobulus morosus KoM1 TaxID=1116472 RepID=V5C391_9GAMM|nr:hypothetical protein [Methyloglobulus morosus]ESS72942.1 hypothetical protein MGMO_41c00080 [Methyloglobulus morosus KoM1]
MYHATKLPIVIKTIVLLTGLLAATEAMAATPLFDSNCATGCHGDGNTGTNVEGVITPPVQDRSLTGIRNSIITEPLPVPEHFATRLIYDFGGYTDQFFVDIVAELNPPSGCIPPQELVNGICTIPTTPSCTAPLVLVNGICATPPPPECDDSANTALCVNQLHQFGSLGSAETAADIYKAICAKPAVAIRATISGLTADTMVSVQVSKGGVSTPVIVDATPGDGIVSGRPAQLAKGPGVYKVKINKYNANVPGIVQYDAAISCLDKRSRRVGANVVIMRNQ